MPAQQVIVSPTVGQSLGLWEGLHQKIVWGRRAVLAIVGLWVFMTALQGLWVYQQAANVHPLLAFAWLLLLAGGAYLVGAPIYRFLKMPRVVDPPKIPPRDQLHIRHLRDEVQYLDRYLKNCLRNVEFDSKRSEIEQARVELQQLRAKLQATSREQTQALAMEISQWSEKRMTLLLADVDRKAERLIYQEAMGVGLATAASPNGTLDAFMMLWRSVNTVSKLAVLYYGRPGLWGTALICKDVSVAVAMAGYLQNVTDSLGGIIAKTVGGLSGVVAGPAIEGTTNALVLIRIGYLAQERCRSFRKWDANTRRSAIVASIRATQRVALGFTAELGRQMASRFGSLAGAFASGITGAAGTAATSIKESFQAIFKASKNACSRTEGEAGVGNH